MRLVNNKYTLTGRYS